MNALAHREPTNVIEADLASILEIIGRAAAIAHANRLIARATGTRRPRRPIPSRGFAA